MEVKLFIGNLSRLTTQEDLFSLFTRAGEVLRVNLITDPKSGISKGFAFITMSAQSEADKAVSMFHSYFLDEHTLKVFLTKPRVQRGFSGLC
jgi:RNA recognition motif-containing protein